MRENDLMGLIGNDVSPYALMSSMLIAAAKQDSKLTPEQKAEREEKRRIFSEQRIARAKVLQNICPGCDGKLARGKKDRKNGYKRAWVCQDCGSVYNL